MFFVNVQESRHMNNKRKIVADFVAWLNDCNIHMWENRPPEDKISKKKLSKKHIDELLDFYFSRICDQPAEVEEQYWSKIRRLKDDSFC